MSESSYSRENISCVVVCVCARTVNVSVRLWCLTHDWGFVSRGCCCRSLLLVPVVGRLGVAGDDERKREGGAPSVDLGGVEEHRLLCKHILGVPLISQMALSNRD